MAKGCIVFEKNSQRTMSCTFYKNVAECIYGEVETVRRKKQRLYNLNQECDKEYENGKLMGKCF